jgi:hypothetical protein
MTPDSWITEYVIQPFPFYSHSNLYVSKVDTTQVWVNKNTRKIYQAIPSLLQEYHADIPGLFWLSIISAFHASSHLESLIFETTSMHDCLKECFRKPRSQVLPLGKGNAFYFSHLSAETLHFNCPTKRVSKPINSGLYYVEMMPTCRFVYPNVAQLLQIDIDTASVKYQYLPSFPENDTTSAATTPASPFSDKTFVNYALYVFYALSILALTGAALWNFRALQGILTGAYRRCINNRQLPETQVAYNAAHTPSLPAAPIVTYAFQMM